MQFLATTRDGRLAGALAFFACLFLFCAREKLPPWRRPSGSPDAAAPEPAPLVPSSPENSARAKAPVGLA